MIVEHPRVEFTMKELIAVATSAGVGPDPKRRVEVAALGRQGYRRPIDGVRAFPRKVAIAILGRFDLGERELDAFQFTAETSPLFAGISQAREQAS